MIPTGAAWGAAKAFTVSAGPPPAPPERADVSLTGPFTHANLAVYVVRAVAQKELSSPDDGFAPASDAQSALLSRINRIYGVAARAEPVGATPANFGFIID